MNKRTNLRRKKATTNSTWIDDLSAATQEEIGVASKIFELKRQSEIIVEETDAVFFRYRDHTLHYHCSTTIPENLKRLTIRKTEKEIEFQVLPLGKDQLNHRSHQSVLWSTTGIMWRVDSLDIINLTTLKSFYLHSTSIFCNKSLMVILFAYHRLRFPILVEWENCHWEITLRFTPSPALDAQYKWFQQINIRLFRDMTTGRPSNLILDYHKGPYHRFINCFKTCIPTNEKARLLTIGMLYELETDQSALIIPAKSYALVSHELMLCYIFNIKLVAQEFMFEQLYTGGQPVWDVIYVFGSAGGYHLETQDPERSIISFTPEMIKAKYKTVDEVALIGTHLQQLIISRSRLHFQLNEMTLMRHRVPSLLELARWHAAWPAYYQKVVCQDPILCRDLDETNRSIEDYLIQF